MRGIYTFGILLYGLGIRFASLFNNKAALWVSGRKYWIEKLNNEVDKEKEYVWFHCASLGEFEQGRPLIERMKTTNPDQAILLTFFSPSGYEIQKNYSYADVVMYMPLDTISNAKTLVKSVSIKMAIFIKYEIWCNHLSVLQKNKIPTYLVSANFREEQIYFKSYAAWFVKHLRMFDGIFVQNEASRKLLSNIGVIDTVKIVGDTRFDRVIQNAEVPFHDEIIDGFCNGADVIVCGSTWDQDVDKLSQLDLANFKLLIAPHELAAGRLNYIKQCFKGAVFYSEINGSEDLQQSTILVVDKIGMLSKMYRKGIAAYIGGGFGKNIHNTLEAVVYGLPIAFGPKFQKFEEAKDMLNLKIATQINNLEELQLFVNELNNKELLESVKNLADKYVNLNVGATAIVFKAFQGHL